MTRPILKFRRLRESAVLPRYMTPGAAGMDICAAIETPVLLSPGERALIPTGLSMELPVGFEGQIRPRSGLALRLGLSMVNTPGTIDSDYRGEVGVLLINLGQDPVTIETGDRIAQLVIAPVVQATIAEVEELTDTLRADGGFGHTGVKKESCCGPDQSAS